MPAVAVWIGCLVGLVAGAMAWIVAAALAALAAVVLAAGRFRSVGEADARPVRAAVRASTVGGGEAAWADRPVGPAGPLRRVTRRARGWCAHNRWGVLAAALCCATAVCISALLTAANRDDRLVVAAHSRAWAVLEIEIGGIPEPESAGFRAPDDTSDPGSAGPAWRVDGTVMAARVAGASWTAATPVVVHGAGPGWGDVTPGAVVETSGRLSPQDRAGTSGVQIRARSPPGELVAAPWWQRAAQRVRQTLSANASALGGDAAGLLPGLVVGDTSGISEQLDRDAKATGVAHLLAVSGSHFAIVCGAVVLALRRVGPRWAAAGGALTLIALVVLVGAQPSVLRAAVMGAITLVALLTGRARTCLPALAACVIGLLLLDPLLALSVGFALSVLATGGLVLLAPAWSTALQRRGCPRGWADALCIPVAAQLVTTPVIVAISGTVPVFGVLANLLVAPVVALALILGVGCAAAGPWWPGAATVLARAAAVPLDWIAWVAHRVAAWPGAVLAWPSSPLGLGTLVVAIVAGLVLLRQRRFRLLAVAAAAGAAAVLVPAAVVVDGWPPPGWLLAACEVGQGDALVVTTGEAGAAMVVDAGPDPGLVDRCLDRLGIATVPLLVLTHLHADHVDGLAGVLGGRSVGAVLVGPGREPAYEWDAARRLADAAAVPVVQWPAGTTWRSAGLTVRVMGPERAFVGTESDPNNDSVVLLAEVDGIRLLLTGDIEPEAQRALLGTGADLAADVLKVPHHGSANTLPQFLAAVSPRVAVIGVGADNGYGHPNPRLLQALSRAGVGSVLRTDRDGDVTVLLDDGGLATAVRGPAIPP